MRANYKAPRRNSVRNFREPTRTLTTLFVVEDKEDTCMK